VAQPLSKTGLILGLLIICGCGGENSPADGGVDAGIDGGTDAWQPLPKVLGGAIQEIGVVELDGKIYVIGGFTGGGEIVPDVRVYDIAAGTWSDAAPVPQAIHHANAAAANGKIYVVGALQSFSFVPIGNVWEYDPVDNDWTSKSPLPEPYERGASAVGVVGGVIYVAGGTGAGGTVAHLTSYDPQSDMHNTTLAPMPEARNHLVGAGVGGKFYAIGGRSEFPGTNARVDEYDPVGDSWTPRQPMPTARGGMAAGVVDGKVIVVGGEGNTNQSGVFPQAEMYDPQANEWTSLPDMLTPRHGTSAAGSQGKLYVPGGATQGGFGAVDTFEVLTP
jgi:N-acetylneuraminic acid mutarotase